MGPSGRITHAIGYIGYIGYIALFGTGICRFCIWVELPVQRRLYPIFVRNVGSPDIHECFRGLTGSQRTPRFGASQLGIRAKVNDYLGSSVGVSISLVLIPASQLGIRA